MAHGWVGYLAGEQGEGVVAARSAQAPPKPAAPLSLADLLVFRSPHSRAASSPSSLPPVTFDRLCETPAPLILSLAIRNPPSPGLPDPVLTHPVPAGHFSCAHV